MGRTGIHRGPAPEVAARVDRSARAILTVQKAAAERLRRDVLGSAIGHRYFRDLARHVRAAAAPATHLELFDACARAELLYVGEFHAVEACQRFAARLLEEMAGRVGRLALGIEFVYARQQPLLDRRQAGTLDDPAFLRRIHYREEWGYPWEGYRLLLDRARRLGVPVYALDVAPRAGFDGLPRRDEHAARRITSLLQREPDRRLIVLFGESHLSRNHVPRRVRTRLARAGIIRRELTVVQDPDFVYWSFVSRGEPVPPAARVDDTTFAVFHGSPLEKYEAYRQILERWRDDAPPEEDADLTPAVHHLIEVLLRWLDIRPDRRLIRLRAGWEETLSDTFPEVYSGGEAEELLPGILQEHSRSDAEIAEAIELFERRGALYESRSNTMFLRKYLPGRAAGEGARFLRVALTGRLFGPPKENWSDPAARAYGAAYDEALAFLGARLVDPAIDLLSGEERETLDAEASGTVTAADEVVERIHWLEAHRKFEVSKRFLPSEALLAPLRGSRPLRRALARDLGHRLGQRLLDEVRGGAIDRAGLRALFSRPLEPERVQRQVVQLLRGRKGR